ncbi:O-methyltransferase [Jiulongibacter sediminis]|uniref:Methyltransferase n=1 Tax=Jiulongibacter sediminis TaxID=1605367 RepID=A0A0P7C387_9BACT|nr:O-methyltransferase [Jiulongibacter sediminis]KPM49091.1 methyltransferase [Jiulongibacter sediminis]TBX26149.1 methyltransferase [Jiulongibacter sediminis]
MLIINPDAEAYCEALSDSEPAVLQEINRDTHANVMQPRMLSGHFQGRLLSMISHLIKPEFILEIGTYTGYSAICLAEGLKKNGRLLTIDYNEEIETLANANISKAGLTDQIELRIGKAAEIIPEIETPIDLVFIDADKLNYGLYYDLVIDKVRSGGLILSDNVLWDGKVFDSTQNDKKTKYLREFNQKVKNDTRTEKILLPFRDGLFVTRKK